MNKYIYPLIENPFSDDDIIKGIKVLKSKQLTLSKETKNFEKSLDLMSYRGPDDKGIFYVKNNFLFGHRRLSIQDLSSNGHQPMHLSKNKYTIVFNGEIYNFIDLRNM